MTNPISPDDIKLAAEAICRAEWGDACATPEHHDMAQAALQAAVQGIVDRQNASLITANLELAHEARSQAELREALRAILNITGEDFQCPVCEGCAADTAEVQRIARAALAGEPLEDEGA